MRVSRKIDEEMVLNLWKMGETMKQIRECQLVLLKSSAIKRRNWGIEGQKLTSQNGSSNSATFGSLESLSFALILDSLLSRGQNRRIFSWKKESILDGMLSFVMRTLSVMREDQLLNIREYWRVESIQSSLSKREK